MVDDLSRGFGKNHSRPGEIEYRVTSSAVPAQSFDRRSRDTASRADWTRDRHKRFPARWAHGSVPAVENLRTAKNTSNRKQDIE
jgi:hypothetical protein